MKKQKIAGIITISFFSLGIPLAKAQYYATPPPGTPPPPPPPTYYAPPPPPPAYAAPAYSWFPPDAGPFIRGEVGPTFFQNGTLKEFGGPVNAPVSYDVGVSAAGAVGYAFDKYVSLDFETGYVWGRINSIPGYSVNGSTIGNVPFLGNVTLSLPIPHTNIVPYIGGGVGGSESIFDGHAFSDGVTTVYGTEDDTVFAYQGFAGMRFTLGPNVSLGVGYKYFATQDPTFSYPPSPNFNVAFKGVQTHTIMFTLQCNF